MREIRLAVVVALALFAFPVLATPAYASGGPDATFARTYGGPAAGFFATSVRQTMDGGFIVAGLIPSFPTVQTWLLRLDETGGIIWQKGYATCGLCSSTFSLGNFPEAVQTPDGGFVVESTANVSLTTTAAWVAKVDKNGGLAWQEAFTGGGNATASSIDLAADGGIVVAGDICLSSQQCNIITASAIAFGALVLRLNSMGGLVWQKAYVLTTKCCVPSSIQFSVKQTSDRGYVVAGMDRVLRLDPLGGVIWQMSYSGNVLFSVQQTSDGGFIAAGVTVVLRLDPSGVALWGKSYGPGGLLALSIRQTSDGGFIVTGATRLKTSFLGALAVRLDSLGNVIWQRVFSGPSLGFSVQQTLDEGFVFAGLTVSSVPRALVFKLSSHGEIHPCKDLSKSSLISSTLSTPATPITGMGTNITSAPIITTFTPMDTTATTTVLCHHGFKP